MTEHLSSPTLSALVDGELSTSQLSVVKEHLDSCPSCTSAALAAALLKTTTAKAGQRYTVADGFQNRMKSLIAQENARVVNHEQDPARSSMNTLRAWSAFSGWAAAALLLVVVGLWSVTRQNAAHTAASLAQQTNLATEISDLHVATLAANQPLQVLSSDRHTVKPWFQGKIPFTFNLPEQLPAGATLLGANLAYLHNQPIAQLVYAIGQHRVSVFVGAKSNGGKDSDLFPGPLPPQHAGFQISGFTTESLSVVAISDVDRARFTGLINVIEQAQK
ncbi:zf-HC2 domain-containing protein [Terracidiphilus gabretensis]|jgi:anti-sigma factor RsiW|uniref:zf-HC2 domain-containing protein n=1 Tax=Terracidiphilus gabretensis TaxID=1577687 RepID=UPI00071BE209|nr:zf-HC2 domain-containing protein [Terracidiphilus gabretensis]